MRVKCVRAVFEIELHFRPSCIVRRELYSGQRAVCIVLRAMCNVQCTACNVQCFWCSVQRAVCIVLRAVCRVLGLKLK